MIEINPNNQPISNKDMNIIFWELCKLLRVPQILEWITKQLDERNRVRELNEQLEGLTNHLFFVRYDRDMRGKL